MSDGAGEGAAAKSAGVAEQEDVLAELPRSTQPQTAEEAALIILRNTFTQAFDANRGTLAAFAKCESEADLDCVRDGFFLGMGAKLFPEKYEPVQNSIIETEFVAEAAGTAGAFAAQMAAARLAPGWDTLVASVKAIAITVGSDLDEIWRGLETGRREWIRASTATHTLKHSLKDALQESGGTDADQLECKMVWIYSIATMLPQTTAAAKAWGAHAGISDPTQPLAGFDSTKWDPRLPAWAPIDTGVQAGADRGGTTLDDAWNLV